MFTHLKGSDTIDEINEVDDEVKEELAEEDIKEEDIKVDSLVAYVLKHTRVEEDGDVDMHFFNVKIIKDPKVDELKDFIKKHTGEFNEVDVFDNTEHGYIELGGWIGDQGIALRFMALGNYLKLWELFTPKIMLPTMPIEFLNELAG
jgi:hypothetical protein